MWKTKISPICSVEDLILKVTETANDKDYRKRFKESIPNFKHNSDLYQKYAIEGRLTDLQYSSDFRDYQVTDEEIYNLYDSGFHGRMPGREMYQEYVKKSKNIDSCPFCLNPMRKPELDHFLPRSKFKKFSMEPWNLVPSCKDCNGIKLDHWSEYPYIELFNPYFTYDMGDWLSAKLKKQNGFYVVIYYIDKSFPDPEIRHRIDYHFNLFKLNEYYSMKASVEIPSICDRLNQKQSFDERKSYLLNERKLEISRNSNSWKGLLYQELAYSNEFCKSGYKIYLP